MKNQEKKHSKPCRENGSAIIIVFIAVVLLAALTFAVISSDRGNTNNLTAGQAQIAASEIMKYARSVESAVKKLQLVNECSEDQISFENNAVSGYTNANSPVDNSCHVFDVNGGGLTWVSPNNLNDNSEWYFTDSTLITDVNSNANGELIMLLPNTLEEICREINRRINISDIPQDQTPAFSSLGSIKFTGGFSAILDTLSDAGSALDGNKTGCFEGGGVPATGTYHFYHVLIAR